MADPYNTKNYREQGGERDVIGGEIDVVTGGKLKIAGVDKTAALAAVPPEGILGVAASYKLARGVGAVTGTLDVNTGLGAVVAAVATMKDDASLTNGTSVTVADGAAGHIVLKVWKPTSSSVTTPVAGAAAVSVAWIAIGTA